MTRGEALTVLTSDDYGYGPIAARGLLMLADRNGTYTDGGTVIRTGRDQDGPTYQIGA